MQALKKELQLLLPSIRIFLDVENLRGIDELELEISRSDSVLIFLSAGYFARWNCLREVREAVAQQKNLILLRECSEMHGGGSMVDMVDFFWSLVRVFRTQNSRSLLEFSHNSRNSDVG